MKLWVNGDPFDFNGDNVRTLLEEWGAPLEKTAVMINDQVMPSTRWDAISLQENDRVELLTLAAGG